MKFLKNIFWLLIFMNAAVVYGPTKPEITAILTRTSEEMKTFISGTEKDLPKKILATIKENFIENSDPILPNHYADGTKKELLAPLRLLEILNQISKTPDFDTHKFELSTVFTIIKKRYKGCSLSPQHSLLEKHLNNSNTGLESYLNEKKTIADALKKHSPPQTSHGEDATDWGPRVDNILIQPQPPAGERKFTRRRSSLSSQGSSDRDSFLQPTKLGPRNWALLRGAPRRDSINSSEGEAPLMARWKPTSERFFPYDSPDKSAYEAASALDEKDAAEEHKLLSKIKPTVVVVPPPAPVLPPTKEVLEKRTKDARAKMLKLLGTKPGKNLPDDVREALLANVENPWVPHTVHYVAGKRRPPPLHTLINVANSIGRLPRGDFQEHLNTLAQAHRILKEKYGNIILARKANPRIKTFLAAETISGYRQKVRTKTQPTQMPRTRYAAKLQVRQLH